MTNVQSVSPTESQERQGKEVKRQACKCELCGVEMGEEEEGDGQAEGQEEGQAAKSLPQPGMPSRKIVGARVDAHPLPLVVRTLPPGEGHCSATSQQCRGDKGGKRRSDFIMVDGLHILD